MVHDLPDGTLGGYLAKHARPPAFEGADGSAYSVDIYVTEGENGESSFSGALLFVRWSGDGVQPTGHVETDDLVTAPSRGEVKAYLHRLTLLEVKAHLDALISARKELPDW